MKLSFLWDEEKTRKLHRLQLIVLILAAITAEIYVALLPQNPYKGILYVIPPIYALYAIISLFTLSLGSPGVRFLITLVLAQILTAVFIALTGGLTSIVQFSPYALILIAVFSLGPAATIILGIVGLISILGVMVFEMTTSPRPDTIANFFFYTMIYIFMLILDRNIGHQISLQFDAARRMEQVDDLKNQFLTVASHYLRTPISVIKASLENMSKMALSSEAVQDIENIKVSTGKLEILIEKFLKVSSIEKGKISITKWPGDLNSLVNSTVAEFQPMAKLKSVSLIFQPQQPLNFPFDPINLKEALVNLLDNAIKFNRPGGQVLVNIYQEKGEAVIKIADSGIGISKEHLETLFSTFNRGSMEQTLNFDKPGVGLGLYLTKLIVEAHGGTISAESMEGRGSTFTINIPFS